VVGNTTLFGLLDDDVDASSGETLAGAADRARRELRDVFAARIEQRRPATIVRAIGVAIATAIVVAAICFADIRIRRRIASRLDLLVRRSGEPSLGLPGRPLLSSTARIVLDAAVWTIRILVAYVALAIVLRQLPYTRPLSERLGDFLLALLGGLGARLVSALPGLLVAIIIFTVTRLVARSLARAFDRVEEGRLSVSWLHATTVPATRRIVRVVLWLFALSVAYPYLPGSDTAAFKGISVFVGAMLTLGSTALVAQLMSGLVIIYSQALKPGDLVQIGETMGFVTDVGMLSTKLRTTRGEQITIPNALVIGNKVTNFVEDALIAAKVSIGYNVAWRQVHEMLLMAAQRTPGLRAQPAPYVVQRALSDFSAEYELRAQPERFDERLKTLYALHAHIQDVFHELGVQIMVPHFEMQPDQPVVPPHADSREQIDTEGDATTRATGGGS
jgi:small-conductance mechanosensitive channel